MNHTPVSVSSITSAGAGSTVTVTEKHRAVIISNTGTTTGILTLKFLDKNGANSDDFVIRTVANSGPFYIPCRVVSAYATGSTFSILHLV